ALAGEAPQAALENALPRRDGANRRAARDLVGDLDREVVVASQEGERATALWLREGLRPQVRGPDRVRVGDDVGTPVLVAADGERQPKRENQTHDPEQRRLEDADRFVVRLLAPAQVAARQHAPSGGPEDAREEV